MKSLFSVIASLVLVLSATTAKASQFEIYVTGATHVSQQQEELASLVQKGIFIDTVKKTLSLQLSAVCKTGERCPEFIRSVTLPLVSLQADHGTPTSVSAQGNLILNGESSFTRITITLNANNAMDISINNSLGCKNQISNFIGSPATRSTILF